MPRFLLWGKLKIKKLNWHETRANPRHKIGKKDLGKGYDDFKK